jgi:hypothetical protein
MPTFVHGKDLYFAFGTASSEVNYSTLTKDVKFARTVDKADTSVAGSTAKSSIPGMKDSTLTVSMLFDNASYIVLAALLGTAGKSAVYGPAGNGTGAVKQTMTCYLSKIEPPAGVGGAVEMTCEFTVTSVITDGTF